MEIFAAKLSLSNVFLVKGRHPVLVDTGSPGDLDRVAGFLGEHGLRPADLALIVHTHAHFDHCGNTAALLRQAPQVPTLIHAHDAPAARAGQNQVIRPAGWLGRLAKPFFNRAYAPFAPSIVIDGGISLDAFGLAAHVEPTAGHTPGSLSVVFATGPAIVGDLLAGHVLAPHRADYHVFIDDKQQNNASIRRVIDLGANRFFVGHGGPFAVEDVFRRLDKKCFL
jgi:glyoxylase-like metal-dependent hydrolase (beta-lactamase superfamily II)